MLLYKIVIYLLLLNDANAKMFWCFVRERNTRQEIDLTVAKCVGGKVVYNKTTTTSTSTTTTTTTTPAPTQAPTTTHAQQFGTCKMDIERHLAGYECCEGYAYHPDFTTCCRQSSNSYRIHEHKKESKHVCCGLNAFKRHEAPCRRNPGKNDVLWKARRLKKMGPSTCQLYKYAFAVTVSKKTAYGLYYKSTVKQLYGPRMKSQKVVRELMIPFDKYSPIGSLEDQTFLVLSEQNHLDDLKLDLFVDTNDTVRRVPERKVKKLAKFKRRMFRKGRKLCGVRSNRRRHTSGGNSIV